MPPAPNALPIDTLQPVELADGVEIHLRVAGPAVRSLAWFIDLLIFFVVIFAWVLLVGIIAGGLGDGIAQGVMLLGLFLLAWFYNVVFEMTARGATPGQRAVGVKVASVSGAPVRLPQSIIRNLLRTIDFMPAGYLFGLICCLFTQRFQRFGLQAQGGGRCGRQAKGLDKRAVDAGHLLRVIAAVGARQADKQGRHGQRGLGGRHRGRAAKTAKELIEHEDHCARGIGKTGGRQGGRDANRDDRWAACPSSP
jgi:uncharacterized RDD family membrane protein YckC